MDALPTAIRTTIFRPRSRPRSPEGERGRSPYVFRLCHCGQDRADPIRVWSPCQDAHSNPPELSSRLEGRRPKRRDLPPRDGHCLLTCPFHIRIRSKLALFGSFGFCDFEFVSGFRISCFEFPGLVPGQLALFDALCSGPGPCGSVKAKGLGDGDPHNGLARNWLCLDHSCFAISSLFRVSDFVLRISRARPGPIGFVWRTVLWPWTVWQRQGQRPWRWRPSQRPDPKLGFVWIIRVLRFRVCFGFRISCFEFPGLVPGQLALFWRIVT